MNKVDHNFAPDSELQGVLDYDPSLHDKNFGGCGRPWKRKFCPSQAILLIKVGVGEITKVLQESGARYSFSA